MSRNRKRELEENKEEREKKMTQKEQKCLEVDFRKEMKRLDAARKLQEYRHSPDMAPYFLFYYTTRLRAEEFLKKNQWLSSRNIKDSESEHSRFLEALASTIIGLQPSILVEIDVSRQARFGARFVDTGFQNFIRDMLKCFFPTLRHNLFRVYQPIEFKHDRFTRTFIYLWGNSLDRSPSVPRLTVSLCGVDQQKVSITFIANKAWVDDRQEDIRVLVGNGRTALAMSQHHRLGQDSLLAKLDLEVLLKVVALLS